MHPKEVAPSFKRHAAIGGTVAALAILLALAQMLFGESRATSQSSGVPSYTELPAALTAAPSLSVAPTLGLSPLPVEPTGDTLPASSSLAASPAALEPTSGSPHVGPQYNAPPTLMLHASHEGFDAPEFLRDFLRGAIDRAMRTVTYSDLEEEPALLLNGSADLLIITIDDIFLQAKLNASVQGMIAVLLDADAVAVLGVVTEGKAPDPSTAATLRDLARRGWEIATHGDTHRNLHDIEGESPGHVRFDIRDSKSKILSAVGVEPTVLILPYGQMVDDARLLHKEGIKWAVGISGGRYIDLTDRLIYVGRQAPAGSAQETLEAMLRPFASEQ